MYGQVITKGEFEELSKEERAKYISGYDAETLLKGYNFYRDGFNPIDDDVIDTFRLFREEILRRCRKGE